MLPIDYYTVILKGNLALPIKFKKCTFFEPLLVIFPIGKLALSRPYLQDQVQRSQSRPDPAQSHFQLAGALRAPAHSSTSSFTALLLLCESSVLRQLGGQC